jgi:hypothetical protein
VAQFDETIEKYIGESFNPLAIIKENLAQFTTVESDTERLKQIIEKTEAEVREIVDLCIVGAETCKKYEEELKFSPTFERITEIRQEIITPRLNIQGQHVATFQKFLMHVVQSFHLAFEMEVTMLYHKPEEMLLQFVNWYAFVGDISEICLQSLLKAKGKLYGNTL